MGYLILLCVLGLFTGLLAGTLGIGGGAVLVPIINSLGFSPVEAVATSSLTIILTSSSGSYHNWRSGKLIPSKILLLAVPSLITAQFGVVVASTIQPKRLLFIFGLFLLFNIFLSALRRRIRTEDKPDAKDVGPIRANLARLFTGGTAGFLAGLFGIGGGVILVPLQILLLGEDIKTAIQTSLAVIVITSVSACLGHAAQGNILLTEGILLGVGGVIGAQISARMLSGISNRFVTICFNALLFVLSMYVLYSSYL